MSTLSKLVLPPIWGVDQYSNIYIYWVWLEEFKKYSVLVLVWSHIWKLLCVIGSWKDVWFYHFSQAEYSTNFYASVFVVHSSTALATCPRWCWNSSKNIYLRSSLQSPSITWSIWGSVTGLTYARGTTSRLGKTLYPGAMTCLPNVRDLGIYPIGIYPSPRTMGPCCQAIFVLDLVEHTTNETREAAFTDVFLDTRMRLRKFEE